MAEVILKNVRKVYPNTESKKKKKKDEAVEKKNNLEITDEGVVAVQDFNIDVADKEFIVLVGPSGCGKSTTLRMIAGLEEISGGELFIDGKQMNDVAPKDRDIAMVFQNYALYPHMTVYENIAFPLKLKKIAETDADGKTHLRKCPTTRSTAACARRQRSLISPNFSTASPRRSPAASASAWPSAAPSSEARRCC